jgi:ribosomal protein S18 acetylase RimI-like enzyme
MLEKLEDLYKLQREDIHKAGVVLTDAFQNDPVCKRLLEGARIEQKHGFFESPVRYGLRYGQVYATSKNLEGIAAWVPGNKADMTMWRGIRSGSIISGMKLGMKAIMKMKPIFEPLEADRRAHMKGRVYIYLMIIGVASESQGQGLGGKLLRAIIQESEYSERPLYVETSKEQNIDMYERFGFKVLNKMTHPIIDLPQWEMVREPRTVKSTTASDC